MTSLFPYGSGGPTYRVVPVTNCGALANPSCNAGSAKAGPDGVLRFYAAAFSFCGVSSETFEIWNTATSTPGGQCAGHLDLGLLTAQRLKMRPNQPFTS